MKESINTSLCNNIQHYKPNCGYPILHYERGGTKNAMSRQLVYMLYLNTVTDKGGTRFPYQKVTTPATKGNLILWPAEGFTHSTLRGYFFFANLYGILTYPLPLQVGQIILFFFGFSI